MLASRAATGMLEVLAIRMVRSMSDAPVRGSIKRRELLEDLGEFVAAFSASDVDDHVGVGPFGEGLFVNGLAGPEPTRDGGGAAPGDRVENVHHPLAGDERERQGRGVERRVAGDVPASRVDRDTGSIVDPDHGLGRHERSSGQCGSRCPPGPAAREFDVRWPASPAWWRPHPLVPTVVSHRHLDRHLPASWFERRNVDAAAEEGSAEGIVALGREGAERSLDSIEHLAEEPGPELHAERSPGVDHLGPDLESSGRLVDLDDGGVRRSAG